MTNPDREELFTPDELAVRLDEWANCLDRSQWDLRSDMRCAAIHLRRLASSDGGVKGEPEPVAWPANLSPRTLDLVQRFALALAKKLRLAEEKYGHTDGWLRDDWEAECRDHLYQHLEKGDPRDVAAYCAFMWHHGWITYRPAITAPPADAGMREALEMVAHSGKFQCFDDAAWDIVNKALSAPGATTKPAEGGDVITSEQMDAIETAAIAGQPLTDPFAGKVPCHCHDAVSQRLCLDKDRCYTVEAQPVHAIKMPEYRYQEMDPRGGSVSLGNYGEYTPVTVRGSTSDPSSTRSEVTVAELARSLRHLGKTSPSYEAEARALLDQFEIRRKK